mgnify:CR=1 FL=1
MPCKGLFCASSDERSHGRFAVVLARTENFVWVLAARIIGKEPGILKKEINNEQGIGKEL